MDLNKHLADSDNKPKPFHTSGFARIANNNQIGSTNSTSFGRRREIDAGRKTVMAYNRSALANIKNRHSYEMTNNLEPTREPVRPSVNGRTNSVPQAPIRKYNPYA